jgi:hypothetical protein
MNSTIKKILVKLFKTTVQNGNSKFQINKFGKQKSFNSALLSTGTRNLYRIKYWVHNQPKKLEPLKTIQQNDTKTKI